MKPFMSTGTRSVARESNTTRSGSGILVITGFKELPPVPPMRAAACHGFTVSLYATNTSPRPFASPATRFVASDSYATPWTGRPKIPAGSLANDGPDSDRSPGARCSSGSPVARSSSRVEWTKMSP